MVAKLQHNSAPTTLNFYEKSFQQLSDVQQRQTGLLIGAAVGDAAARALDGYTAEEVAAVAAESGSLQDEDEDPVVFASVTPREHKSGLLRHHSYTFYLFSQLLRVMATSRGDFPVQYVKNEWVATARAHPDCFVREHASLLHVLCITMQLPVIYPWADDSTLREYASGFLEFLTETPAEQAVASREDVYAYTNSVLGVALRCLQSNPDPYRNAAFMAAPGTAHVFPDDLALYCPPALVGSSHSRTEELSETDSETVPLFPARLLESDVRVVRECLVVARGAASFAEGIKAAIHLGGPVCQRSLIVGALLGARMGVRRIPISWLSATYDHVPLVTLALQVAQWSWNPPHH
ncbi:hypothetical protein, conserved [Trypanosoma brucei gambiense DAL972]|uniref:ADP-ribosylglycohydrolase n=2 Tax=Trypanosoma brucei TaxID=5691 RepID=D0A963_TRYB9|nr:hypothetical protein, conserved [Trypanosoma brucei gambiense DAL972]6SGA_FP Chain FP, mt-SAF23 [Trypanosoma brucei brucei]6SGB_FP Chain FP, mt-SAF23 [Trypanosoma brucei brucei]7PUA_FP Chain FP, mt-SAF23 [Trypanosoma brucei brucei]RHW68026.1 ADP-ribosylglycohydrolase [Trypanosoma brucei equiperdum]CBH18214.1 hypothetical protein, conserved [Trypanosoma brucei gambiense DAL972]|eukprot:XP_011780478.1 hypothetical protein, conserved [Trypanosoma brucei gambiense DAL972]